MVSPCRDTLPWRFEAKKLLAANQGLQALGTNAEEANAVS